MAIPGVTTLKDLIDAVRDHLHAWPLSAVLSGAIDAVTNTLTIATGISEDFTGRGAFIEVGDEVMLVTDIISPTVYTVVRGYQGSTAAAHANAAPVSIHPAWSWTDRTIRFQYIKSAIRWLKPSAWVTGVSETFTIKAGDFDVQLPTSSLSNYPHGNHVLQMEYQIPGTTRFIPFYGWKQLGAFIQFGKEFSQDRPVHAILQVFQPQLQELLTPLDNDDFEEAIGLYAAHLAYNSFKSNRARYTEYSAAVHDRASSLDELIRQGFDLKNQAILSREENFRPPPPTYVSTYRPPDARV